MKVKAALAALAIAGGAIGAIVSSAGPALAFYSPPLLLEVHVESPATLVANGAGANVIVQVECAGAGTAELTVGLTERSGSQVTFGGGGTEVGCTDSNQTVVVEVTPQPGDKPFKSGTAIADGYFFACSNNYSVCGSESDTPTISVTH